MKLPTAHEAASLLFTPSVKTCGFATSLGEGGNGRRNIFRKLTAGGRYIIRPRQRTPSLARSANFTCPKGKFHPTAGRISPSATRSISLKKAPVQKRVPFSIGGLSTVILRIYRRR